MQDNPIPEMNDVAPSSLTHLVGQQSVVAQVAVAVEAAWADGKRMDSALMVGPPGVGKSALALVISKEMASDFHEVLGQSITNPSDLNALLLAVKDRDVLHIDEAHELGKEFQTALYLALDQQKLLLHGGKSSLAPESIRLGDFTLLLSTTDEYALMQPLRDRMKLHLRFEFYTPDELTEVLRRRCHSMRWSVQDGVLPMIAQRSRGTPRLALRLLQSCRRVCRADNDSTVSLVHLHRACELEHLDDLGIGPTEQHYLRILAEGTSRLNVVASLLALPARTVSQVVEPFLLRAGLVIKDDSGRRQLTARGREHLARSEQSAR